MGAGSLERDDAGGFSIPPRGRAPRALNMLTGAVSSDMAPRRLPYGEEFLIMRCKHEGPTASGF